MSHLEEYERGTILGLLHAGYSVSATAREIVLTRDTVRKWRDTYTFAAVGNVNDLPKSRQKTGTSPLQTL